MMPNARQARSSSPDTSEQDQSPKGRGKVPLYLKVLQEHRLTAHELRQVEEVSKLRDAISVRLQYKWPWGAGAEYLYRAFIRALGLQDHEGELLRLAKPKPGRRQEREMAGHIWGLKAQGYTVPQIQMRLEREGRSLSKEAVEAYLKTRRRRKQP